MKNAHLFSANSLKTSVINITGIILLLFSATACVTPSKTVKDDFTDRIMAENSQMKKRLPLSERENDVLKQENFQYKTKLQQMAGDIEKLRSNLALLNDKYKNDMVSNQHLIQDLQEEYQSLEKLRFQEAANMNQLFDELESKRNQEVEAFIGQIEAQKAGHEAQVQKLQEEYVALTTENDLKIKALNEQLAMQRTVFSKEKNDLELQYAAKENAFSAKLLELNKSMEEREAQIISLKTANSEISIKFDEISRQLEQIIELDRDLAAKDQKGGAKETTNIELVKRQKNVPGETILKKVNPSDTPEVVIQR